ncbi:hypothetical protein ABZT17_02745 [Streptomyces sp. NPDC005648]|uniref:hypothetical protein n=1 Tax=Streptomyces sp. NPDC005648 TaxID=3157044 RepID=UPI0033ABB877
MKVRRLFIVPTPEVLDDLDETLQEHRNAGIEAGVLVLSELPSAIRVGETPDIAILDGELCFENKTDRRLPPPVRDREHVLHRTAWRRHHQAVATACHQQRHHLP